MSYNTSIDLCYKPFFRTIAFFLVKHFFYVIDHIVATEKVINDQIS
jgi:hypothetical protein